MENLERAVKLGLKRFFDEYRLLRALEEADRRADSERCLKSLNQKSALAALDNFRSMK